MPESLGYKGNFRSKWGPGVLVSGVVVVLRVHDELSSKLGVSIAPRGWNIEVELSSVKNTTNRAKFAPKHVRTVAFSQRSPNP